MKPSTGSGRLPGIDLLRISAAGAVVAYHYVYLFPNNGGMAGLAGSTLLQSIASHGYFGVEIFFAISGYVISLSAAGCTRVQFAIARFLRLWPTFVVCLGLTLASFAAAGSGFSGATIAANLTMLPKLLGFDYIDGVYWSLMFEIIFYAYVLVFLISANFVARLCVFTWGWMALVLLDTAIALPSKLRTILIIDYGPFFAIGIALFIIHGPARRRDDYALLTVATGLGTLFAFSNATSRRSACNGRFSLPRGSSPSWRWACRRWSRSRRGCNSMRAPPGSPSFSAGSPIRSICSIRRSAPIWSA